MTQYVNRRGTKTDVEEALETLPSPSSRPATTSATAARRSVAPLKRRWRVPHLKLSKRSRIIMVGLVVVACGAALVSADSIKRDYERQAAAMRRTISDASKLSPSEAASVVSVADTLSSALSAPSGCRVTGIDVISWYGPAKTARQDCQAVAERYGRLKTALGAMRATSDYLTQVTAVLSDAISLPADDQYAVIGNYVTAWTKAKDDLGKITVPSVAASAHSQLLARVTAIHAGWVALQTANSKQDAAAFTSAQTELTKSYEAFRTSATDVAALLGTAQTAVTQATATPL